MRDVLAALKDLGTASTAAIFDHDAVDLSRQQVFSHLETLQERGVLDREQDPDDGRRLVWLDDGLHRLGEHGDVDLGIVDDVARELDLDSQRAIGIATVVEFGSGFEGDRFGISSRGVSGRLCHTYIRHCRYVKRLEAVFSPGTPPCSRWLQRKRWGTSRLC